ncbi:MAG: AbrB/MazE/SpoVT family DNA-binding domain-containing protein [Gammaproteobacteria bacterium]
METVTISPKYQVVIPRRIREALHMTPGQKVRVIQFDQRVEYVPVTPMRTARGFLKGIETDVPREADRV